MATSKSIDEIRRDIGGAMIDGLTRHDLSAIDAAMLAAETGHDLAVIKRLFPDLTLAVEQGLRDLDDAVMAQLADDFEADADAHPREKILEGLIARYETYAPYKPVIKALNKASVSNPMLGALLVTRLNMASKTILELSGVDTSGLKGMLRVKGLSGVALSCQRDWFNDGSADLAVTIRALDARLKQAESLALTLMIINPEQQEQEKDDYDHSND
jgi:hypothetical protein